MRRTKKTSDNRRFTIYAKDKEEFDYAMKKCNGNVKPMEQYLRSMSKETNADNTRVQLGYPGNRHITYTLNKINP